MYTKELEEMKNLSKEEFLASLRRQSSGFSRGVSKYRGVARHHHNGRWEARIGRVQGNKYMYLGTFNNEEEAAVAYDIAAIKQRGPKALTNFDMSNYADQLREIGEAQFGAQPMDGDNDARRRRGKAQRLTNEEGDRRLLHNNNDFSAEFMELKRYEVPIEADYASSTALNPTIIDEESFFNFWMDTAGEPFPTPSDIHMAEEAEEEKVERESYLLDFFKDGSNDNNLDFLMFEEPCRYPGEFGFGGDMEGRGEDGLEGFTNALPSPTTAAAPAGAAVGNGDETAGFDAALEFFDVPAGFDAASEYF
ncbi:unnamed protein product [Cuscuta europaea]|nr:unnamed protein product [Cuscuta europaea]